MIQTTKHVIKWNSGTYKVKEVAVIPNGNKQNKEMN